MNKEKSGVNLPSEWQDRFKKMREIIEEQQKEITTLKNRKQSGESITFTYLRMFQQFLLDAQANNWLLERKYTTKNTENYIDIDYAKYSDFIREKFSNKEQRQFKDFIVDLNLINSDTFYSKHGKIITGTGENKKRVFRVPKEVFFRFTQNTADIAS